MIFGELWLAVRSVLDVPYSTFDQIVKLIAVSSSPAVCPIEWLSQCGYSCHTACDWCNAAGRAVDSGYVASQGCAFVSTTAKGVKLAPVVAFGSLITARRCQSTVSLKRLCIAIVTSMYLQAHCCWRHHPTREPLPSIYVHRCILTSVPVRVRDRRE